MSNIFREIPVFISRIFPSSWRRTIIGITSLLIIIFIYFSCVSGSNSIRYTFMFPDSKTGILAKEMRYIPKTEKRENLLSSFINELLLGPIDPDYLPIYSSQTKLEDAFIRNKIAYINISKEACFPATDIVSSNDAYRCLKKNVFTNFRNVDKIYIYIDGVELYRENPYADAEVKNKKR